MAKATTNTSIGADDADADGGIKGSSESVVGVGEGEAADGGYTAEQPAIEPKKRRGRRSKAELEASGYYDGKSATKTRAKTVPVGTKEFAGKIKGAHQFAALFTGVPVIALNDEESEQIASAALAVLAQYDMVISPLAAAWVNLIATLGMVYGVRIYAYKAWKTEQENTHQRENGQEASLDNIQWGDANVAAG